MSYEAAIPNQEVAGAEAVQSTSPATRASHKKPARPRGGRNGLDGGIVVSIGRPAQNYQLIGLLAWQVATNGLTTVDMPHKTYEMSTYRGCRHVGHLRIWRGAECE